MSSSVIPLPIEAQLPPTLSFLANPISSYFNANPPYNNVILEALIFTPPPRPPRILLLQRAGGPDPHAFSDYWQVPSGKPSLDDASLLHAITRIVREQTGLTVSYVATMSGTEEGPGTWQTGNVPWMRMLFMVEVAELAPKSRQASEQPESLALDDQLVCEPSKASTEQESELDYAPVQMDASKHRLHAWATEGDFTEFFNTGLYPVTEKTQYQIMLEAFAFYRQDFTRLESLRQIRQNAVFYQGLGS